MSASSPRRAGVLLPIFSLANDGAGLAAAARDFVAWLVAARFAVWQVLPIGPSGSDGSPYWLRSDHATHPVLARGGELCPEEFAAWRERERNWLLDTPRSCASRKWSRTGSAPSWTCPARGVAA